MKYPTSFQATDAVIIDRERKMVLLGKKPNQPFWRFPGGFVDPTDDSLEIANRREIREECGINLEISDPKYLFSFRVDDPRYRDSVDKIMSAVFLSYRIFGKEKPGDDLEEVQWFPLKKVLDEYRIFMMPEHHFLAETLKNFILL